MYPIYKFELSDGNTTQQAFPIYKDDLAKDFEKESGQEFFRAKLSGKLTFESDDYTFIVSKAFDTQFGLEIFISYNAGQTWASYWTGTFWKTDCEFDGDAHTVVVTPSVSDQYNDVLAGMDKEYNLIELAPAIMPVKADKRPMIQVYVPGQTSIGCFLSGMWWEQECEAVSESDSVQIGGESRSALIYKYFFNLNKVMTIADVSGDISPALPDLFTKEFAGDQRFNLGTAGTTDFPGTNYTMRYYFDVGAGGYTQRWQIIRLSDLAVLWQFERTGGSPTPEIITLPQTVVLTPATGSDATGNVTLYMHDMPVYARFVLDVERWGNVDTNVLPSDDLVPNNRNYHRVLGYDLSNTVFFSTRLSSSPTQWGLYQPGQYYQPPQTLAPMDMYPIARNAWGRVSAWYTFSILAPVVEELGRAQFTIRDAYPLWSVLSVLLAKVAPGVTHAPTTDYSEFLYGTNLVGVSQTLLITPKSNIISAGYDQPAQQAPITLKQVLDMLRDCFRCYWFIDSQGRFRIEHIQYFRNGGSYSATPSVGIDLTAEKVRRNNKEWAFARSQYKFEKPEMAARYQFGWMDEVTQPFEGYPIDIVSKYVNPDNIEQINVGHFTSDIDYILLNPSDISKDGFVLLSAIKNMEPLDDLYFVQGSLYAQAEVGATYQMMLQSGNDRIVTGLINVASPVTIINNETNYKFAVYVFDADGKYTGQYSGWKTETTTIMTTGPFIAIVVAFSNDAIILPEDAPHNMGIEGTDTILPYVQWNSDYYLQNGYVAFAFLQQYYFYDLPALNYAINGVSGVALGTKRLKRQTLRFPAYLDPDMQQLVKTNLGNGILEKISVNLSSRNANATLGYDTE